MKKIFYTLMTLMGFTFGAVSCFDDEFTQESYYTFTGQMITDYLTEEESDHPGTFSDFITVLQRAELWDLLSTCGSYTCFAPTNTAMAQYLKEHGMSSVDQLSDKSCDTIACMHLVSKAYFTTDLENDNLPLPNMINRTLKYYCQYDSIEDKVLYYINSSHMTSRNDSVVNGVVHVVDKVITASSQFIGGLVCNDPNLTIFGEAMRLTGLADYIDSHIEDQDYTIGIDSVTSTKNHTKYFGNNTVYYRFPEKRLFKYTIFAVPDSIFRNRKINNIQDLIAKAKSIYDATYPKDAGKYDDDFTNRRNPLNRFIAYHMLDRAVTYSDLTISGSTNWGPTVRDQFLTDKQDMQEYYETMCPYTIMKVVEAAGQKYVNRKGLGAVCKATLRGARIITPTEAISIYPNYSENSEADNGFYYYVDDIIKYDAVTTEEVLNCRMRIDATTLSPDFMNAGARDIQRQDRYNDNVISGERTQLMMGFKKGFAKNFIFGDDTFFGVHERFWSNSFEDDMCACVDNFDIKFKLPPVPAGKTYEVRLGYNAGSERTVVQIYFDDNMTGDIPCGIPVDLRKFGGAYGWEFDADLGDEEAIEANDKAMRNQGYMKGPDSYTHVRSDQTMRNNTYMQCLRRILTTRYFEEEHDYYIRLRQVLDNKAEMSLDYIEIVPKSVFNGSVAEDRN